MRIAVLSDIHANLTALEAVIADLHTTAPDLTVCGGDLVGGGARPAEVVDRVRDFRWPSVYGNTDEMLWRPELLTTMLTAPAFRRMRDTLITTVVPMTLTMLGAERLAWLQALPTRWSHGELLSVVHAGPDTAWRSPSATAPDAEFEDVYRVLGTKIVVYGHVHQPFVRDLRAFTVANSGSVSLSYDGDPRASYLVIDGDQITIRRVAYDIDAEVACFEAVGFPDAEWYAQVLRGGRYVPYPTDPPSSLG
jgi:predicted phosphodiesterase